MGSTTGMRGGGFYDAHSAGQRAAMDVFVPWIVDAIADLPLPENRSPIGLLDLGSSEGANAIHAVGEIIRAVRERTQANIWTFFDDLPTNDFNQLFANLFPDSASVAAVPETAAFRIDRAEALECSMPFNEEFRGTGDARVWAKDFTGWIRAFSEPVVTARLPTGDDRMGLVEELYRRMEDRFAADPGRYEFHYISLGALLTRV